MDTSFTKQQWLDKIHEHFEYRDSDLYWLVPTANVVKVGDLVGSINSDGYVTTKFFGRRCYVHQLVWAFHYNVWPDFEIDHKDRIRDNNDINNLRPASRIQQLLNTGLTKGNATNCKGVSFDPNYKKPYRVWINFKGYINIDERFDTREQAVAKASAVYAHLEDIINGAANTRDTVYA